MIVTLLPTSVHNFPGHRAESGASNAGGLLLLILCFIFLPSSLLFSGSNNCGVAVIRGEGIIPFWRNYVPGYNVTDLFSIEHSPPDQDTWAQTCLAKAGQGQSF